MSKRKKEELEGYDFYDDIDELDRASEPLAVLEAVSFIVIISCRLIYCFISRLLGTE